MKLTIDPDAEAVYLRLNEAEIADSEQVASGVVVDYDREDNIVGVEVLHLSRRGSPIEVQKLVFERLKLQDEEAALRETPPPYGAKGEEHA